MCYSRTAKTSKAGDFGRVVEESLYGYAPSDNNTVTVRDIDMFLQELSGAEDNTKRAEILGDMLRKTSPKQQKWIVRIIVKDLKLGVREKTILDSFHQDAYDLYNRTSSLSAVCEECKSTHVRIMNKQVCDAQVHCISSCRSGCLTS